MFPLLWENALNVILGWRKAVSSSKFTAVYVSFWKVESSVDKQDEEWVRDILTDYLLCHRTLPLFCSDTLRVLVLDLTLNKSQKKTIVDLSLNFQCFPLLALFDQLSALTQNFTSVLFGHKLLGLKLSLKNFFLKLLNKLKIGHY